MSSVRLQPLGSAPSRPVREPDSLRIIRERNLGDRLVAGEKTLAGVEKAIRQEGNKSSDQEAPKQDAAAPPPALETKSGASNGEFATEHLVNISEH